MSKGLTRKKYSTIIKDAEKIAKILKTITRPLSMKILLTIRESRRPMTWKEISDKLNVGYYNHYQIQELYNCNLIEPVDLDENRMRGWALNGELIIFLLSILEHYAKMPSPKSYEVLKFEKKSKELEKAVQRKHIQDEIIKKAQILKDSGDIEGYNVLMRLLAENVF